MVHPSADIYGSDRVFAESVRALVAGGWSVDVVAGSDGPLRDAVEGAGARFTVGRVPVLRKAALSPSGLAGLAGELPGAARAAAAVLRSVRPDVVYVNTVTLPAWIGFARRRRARVVCHVHEAEHQLPAPVRTARSGTILVAEDEPGVRRLVEAFLRGAGHDVLVAPDGAEALALAAARGGRVDLLLTDVVMPGMNGRELHQALCQARPGLPVLYMSGYPALPATLQDIVDGERDAFIAKPFTRAQLLARVEEMLRAPARV